MQLHWKIHYSFINMVMAAINALYIGTEIKGATAWIHKFL